MLGFAAAARAALPLMAGVYGPNDSGMQQWTSSLQPTGTYPIENLGGMTGAAISADGLLLTEGFVTNVGSTLFAIGQNGVVDRSVYFSNRGLYRGSGIVVVPSTGVIYASAGPRIVRVTPNFASVTELPITLGRAAAGTGGRRTL